MFLTRVGNDIVHKYCALRNDVTGTLGFDCVNSLQEGKKRFLIEVLVIYSLYIPHNRQHYTESISETPKSLKW